MREPEWGEIQQAARPAQVGVGGGRATSAADLVLELDREAGEGTLDAELEGGGVDQEAVGHEHRVVRLGVLDGLACDQRRRHVDDAAAALCRLGRLEFGVVVDAVVGPGA